MRPKDEAFGVYIPGIAVAVGIREPFMVHTPYGASSGACQSVVGGLVVT